MGGMLKHTFTRFLQIQFVRQLTGAGVGALAALAVYTVYTEAHDAVRAYLVPPGADRASYTGEVRVADKSVQENDEQIARIAARARENAERLRMNQQELMQAGAQRMAAPAEETSPGTSVSSAPTADLLAAAQAQQDRTARLNERARIGSRAASSSASAAASASAETLRAGAPNLPNSGIGLWMAAAAALGASFASTRKLRMLLQPAESRVD